MPLFIIAGTLLRCTSRTTTRSPLSELLLSELPLSEVNEAFRLIEEREVFGKVVLKP